MTSHDWALAAPFWLSALAIVFITPIASRRAKKLARASFQQEPALSSEPSGDLQLEEERESQVKAKGKPAGRPTGLDYYADVAQGGLIVTLPALAFLYALRNASAALLLMSLVAIFALLPNLLMLGVDPAKYEQRSKVLLSPLSWLAVILNIVCGFLIFYDVFGGPAAPATAASELIADMSGSSRSHGGNEYEITIRIREAGQLGGRVPWAANVANAGDGSVAALAPGSGAAFAGDPCHRVEADIWKCSPVFLGGIDENGSWSIYVVMVDSTAVGQIVDAWKAVCPTNSTGSDCSKGSGYLSVPAGVDVNNVPLVCQRQVSLSTCRRPGA